MASPLFANRYLLQQKLGQGGMGVVHQAKDLLTDEIVALKHLYSPLNRLNFGNDDDTDKEVLALAKEFRLLASLRHPHIISVIDFGFSDNQPFYTMTHLDNVTTLLQFASSLPLYDKITLFVQMLHALHYLHRQGIIHRDLSSSNVVVHQNQVKVLDFGIAQTIDHDQPEESLSGTIRYIAPEVFSGKKASPASDLYAAGLFLYELLEGKYPFETRSVTEIVFQIMNNIPQFSSYTDEISIDLVAICQKLVAKNPQDRYLNAAQVLVDIRRAFKDDIPIETPDTRESFLQGARFIGRSDEIEQLKDAVNQLEEGKGSAWLIGGESGVGKSRLLSEIEIWAKVKGLMVLKGISTAEQREPYDLFQQVVSRLALANADNPAINYAKLSTILPDLPPLVQESISENDIQPASREVIFSTTKQLIHAYQRPCVIIFEDIHWEIAGLDLLKSILPLIEEQPLTIIASYRNDERPQLPNELDAMTTITLNRLPEEDVSELAMTMLGTSKHPNPDFISTVHAESEGNPFFIVEIIRSLAESVEHLDEVINATIPNVILSGGIQKIVQRRLSKVADWAKPLLQLAAIQGRAIDIKLLRLQAGSVDLDQWLQVCLESAVLEVNEDTWRFAHDKIRDALEAGIDTDEKVKLHWQTAETLEKLYGTDPLKKVQIAYHWRHAGNISQEITTSVEAGNIVMQMGMYQQAIELFERIISIEEENIEIIASAQKDLGLAQYRSGDADTAIIHLQEAIRLYESAGNDLQKREAKIRLANVYGDNRDFEKSNQLLNEVIANTDATDNPLIIIDAKTALGWNRFLEASYKEAVQLLEEALSLFSQLSDHEKERKRGLHGHILNDLAGAYAANGHFDQSSAVLTQAIEIHRDLHMLHKLSISLGNLARLHLYRNSPQDALEAIDQAIEIDRQMGANTIAGERLSIKGNIYHQLERYDDALAEFAKSTELMRRRGNLKINIIMTNLAVSAHIYHRQNQRKQSAELLLEALDISEEVNAASKFIQITLVGSKLMLDQSVQKAAEWFLFAKNHPALAASDLALYQKEVLSVIQSTMSEQDLSSIEDQAKQLKEDDIKTELRAFLTTVSSAK